MARSHPLPWVLLPIAVIALAAAVVSAQVPLEPETSFVNILEPNDASADAASAVTPDLPLKITPQQAASRSRQCSSCTGTPIAPVCADIAGISVTVASRCIAECQELSNIRTGTCEDLATDSPGEINTQSAALVQPTGARRAVAPSFRSACRPSTTTMQQMLLEGKTFVGCVQAASKAAAAQAATAGRAPNATTVADLLASLQPSDTVVLTERVVASRGGAMFLKPRKVTVTELMSVSTPGASSSTLPGRRAPTSEAWGQAQSQVAAAAAASATSIDTAGNDTTVLAAMAQAAAAELAAASSAELEPAADLADGTAGGNRRLAQVVDNRQLIRDTTAWPWPALSKITIGCSGTLMSPDDLVTAAHCVVDSVTGRSYQPWTIIPGKNGDREPYGRFTAGMATWWNIWVGGSYNGQNSPVGGSAYIDVAVIRLDRGVTWWNGVSRPCGRRTMSVRGCGYPGGNSPTTPPGAAAGNWPYCSDGTTREIDFCDATTDYIRSSNCVTSGGQSGGPLYDRTTNAVTGVVSGGPSDMSDNWYTPFDNTNWPLLYGTANRATIWSRTFLFRSTRGLIRSALNNRCLDAPNWTAGQRVHMWDCHGRENQQWAHPGAPTLGTEMRLTVGTNRNLCLDAASSGTANGTPLIAFTCSSGNNQMWFFDHNGRLRSFMNPNKCIDIASSNTNNGAQLVLWDCNGGANQRWIEG